MFYPHLRGAPGIDLGQLWSTPSFYHSIGSSADLIIPQNGCRELSTENNSVELGLSRLASQFCSLGVAMDQPIYVSRSSQRIFLRGASLSEAPQILTRDRTRPFFRLVNLFH